MQEIIQNITFPQNDMLEEHSKLYYRGAEGVLLHENEKKYLVLPAFQQTEFSTYLNGCSIEKWKKYTNLETIKLYLTLEGKFILKLYAYSLRSVEPERKLLLEKIFDLTEKKELEIEISEVDEQTVGFELHTLAPVTFWGGRYVGDFSDAREVNLAISTTTCKKEEFITRNAKILKAALLDSDTDIARHLFMNIVDNGGTLKREDFPADDRIRLFPNKNVGGSGGFARGMLEALHQKEHVTHVLLMDDDILIQPEAIYRTYILLKHLKKEYQKCFVSGAMLHLENASIQKEDVGVLTTEGFFMPLKKEFNQEYLWDNLKNEQEYPLPAHTYAAWWYCCIPIETIKEQGLPMPIFVRGDDVEYGLRCNPGFITMNGICVWHMGFAGKFNVGMDHYQVNRNLLINQAVTGLIDDVNVIRKTQLDFRKHILRLDYDSAEIALRALEDYLKGPDFIRQDLGEKILVSNNQLGHKMVPMKELGNPEVGLGDPYDDPKRQFVEKWLFRVTYNGHRFRFLSKLKDGVMSVPYNDVYTPSRIAFRKKLVAINPMTSTGYMLERNQERYRELMKRYRTAMAAYKKNQGQLVKQYRACKEEFRTEKFWKAYLEI
ncbi:glycosyltransferase [Clostridium sp. AM42-4]|uniref:glycosyltransferase n=1 Tax=Clostridium sp. AM42-4 TaxID=2292305 RepID=UPI000E4E28BC|nr:glycosyltransferase [Clostridium sp. AM42-4]RHS91028.1 glycosyltransferase family 2 protein [Clostridium sp. AM42-4]